MSSSSLSVGLYSAVTALHTSQSAMANVSQNVANSNTEGYTRKVASQSSLMLGGVTLNQITRAVDAALTQQQRNAASDLAKADVRASYTANINESFGSPSANTSLSATLNNLQSTVEALATAPESTAIQNQVVQVGIQAATQMNNMSAGIQALRQTAENDISSAVTAVNNQLGTIATLNGQIMTGMASGQDVTDLQDKRDIAAQAIAEQMNVRVYTRASGEMVLSTSAGQSLVDGVNTSKLSYTATTAVTAASVFNHITVVGQNIDAQFTSGRISGLMEQRDVNLVARTAELNKLAIQMDTQMQTAAANLATTTIAASNSVAGHFFSGIDIVTPSIDNAATIAVHPDLIATPSLLNNTTAARALADAMEKTNINFAATANGVAAQTTSLSGYASAIVTNSATLETTYSTGQTYQQSIKASVDAKAAQVSGVSLDEEMTNLIELQKSYSAAGKVVQSISSMFDVLDNLIR